MGHEQAEEQQQEEGSAPKGWVERLTRYLESRTGMNVPMLRPVPEFSINPFYWLGALTVVAFLIQGVTGMILLINYSPTVTAAYSSTQYIFKQVYFGQFLETIHLYTAYAMIMLAFMHMMRGYFVSVQKKPREIMWITGMIMGFVTLGFGFTGYLLPWTVVSVSASDVGVGMVASLPAPLANLVNFLIVGGGGQASELLRFYDLHVVILPAVLLALLLVKMNMLETHGVAMPVAGPTTLTDRMKKLLPLFPDVTVYLLELSAIFGVGMVLISALFPLQLGPQYSPTAASGLAAQPDWYFLWLYQILKISIFEKLGVPVALTVVTIILGAMTILPFIDRGKTRRIIERPKYVAVGAVFAAELIVLAAWGLETPGQIISDTAAVEILGGTALVVALAVFGIYAAIRPSGSSSLPASSPSASAPMGTHAAKLYEGKWTGAMMTSLMAFGALGIGVSIDSIVKIAEFGVTNEMLTRLTWSLCVLAAVIVLTLIALREVGMKVGRPEQGPLRKMWSRLGLS